MDETKNEPCYIPGRHEPTKSVEQATRERVQAIKKSQGGCGSHFTDDERAAARATR
jgi:hypothetical protein